MLQNLGSRLRRKWSQLRRSGWRGLMSPPVAESDSGPAGHAADAGPRRPQRPPIDARLDERLSGIEQAALAVYRRHGLPVQAGDYRRGPRGKRWTFIGDTLSPEERWAAIIERPPEKGWRHARLEDIGGFETAPALVEASRLLVRCRYLRGRLYGLLPGDPAQDLLAAIDLGAAWKTAIPEPTAVKPKRASPRPRREGPATAAARRGPRSGS
tara:strand:- start:1093 stop:1728 length:636 start_codon:yes stop_codon:yes gene_type:complete